MVREGSAMRIGIIGSGMMGAAVGELLQARGAMF